MLPLVRRRLKIATPEKVYTQKVRRLVRKQISLRKLKVESPRISLENFPLLFKSRLDLHLGWIKPFIVLEMPKPPEMPTQMSKANFVLKI